MWHWWELWEIVKGEIKANLHYAQQLMLPLKYFSTTIITDSTCVSGMQLFLLRN